MQTYGQYSGVSGVQPKVLVRDSASTVDRLSHRGAALSSGLRNGDAHLKNFGVLYEDCGVDAPISLAPAYDIITTSVYIKSDSMALLLGGSKAWPKYKMLMRFGRSACNLTEGRCNELLQQVIHGMAVAMDEMGPYIKANSAFAEIGGAMLEQWSEGMARSLVKG
ncbi:hypothetical protein PS659_02220 [Pseudomonas fluorescens]|uniref:HipA-like C-terminal domain-containing protein n=1 Tax=Pseudomonas fluorescens TaxID=294 RepID=A0A5E6SCB1_PSEFL|nr:hypothetical protein PS659_02220 [Pseudomonas fluorescens]